MEARIGGEAHHFYSPDAPIILLKEKDLRGIGKRSLDWDLNDWKWDGDLFIASPSQSVPSGCRSRQLFPVEAEVHVAGGFSNSSSSSSDEINLQSEKSRRELEKRRRVAVIEDNELNDKAGNLNLKLGGHVYPIVEDGVANWDGKSGKKTKLLGGTINRAVCQVDDCGADLSNAKDYHKRHKVCEIHSKASKALVRNVMQRFCQQCSRFHLLQEFDEGKRSCRRRLAGHNKRRRKTHPDAVANGSSLNDERASSYLLISLLRILSNLHSNNSDQSKDQDILSHLLRNLASFADLFDGRNTSGLLLECQNLLNAGTSAGTSSKILPAFLANNSEPSGLWRSTSTINGGSGVQNSQMRPVHQYVNVSVSEAQQQGDIVDNACGGALQTVSPKPTTLLPVGDSHPAKADVRDSTTGRIKLNNIDLNYIYNDSQDCVQDFERSRIPLDLNNMYNDSQDCIEGFESSQIPVNLGTGSPDCPSWVQQDSHHSSPPQTSGNLDAASDLSPSNSSGDTQGRTDRIVFKLFGKDPNDFPLILRAQVLDWLSNSPTDIESYIRPGCIILTVYIRLAESTWEELCADLSSSLSRLLNVSNDPFWKSGWVYTRVQHRITFMYNGQVVLDMPLPFKKHNNCRISSITPVAVCASERTQFIVKGFNLSQSTTSLLCALEGKYLVQESTHDLEGADSFKEDDELQCLSFTCSVPDVTGRGFIEVEDHGLSSSFFPYIVAEQDVCTEICMLESALEISESDDDIQETTGKMEAKNRALDFIHEMGWLLHRSRLRSRLGHMDPNLDAFPFTRFRGILEFSINRDWCAVIKKLLDILFEGTVDAGDHPSVELALSEMGLLHRAVWRSCRPVVELLLRYVPDKASDKSKSEHTQRVNRGLNCFFFKPDAIGPAGLTPLHVAASRDGSENMLDVLTDDPGSVGIVAWKSARDNTGFTPDDYARLRGHYSYIHLVQKKINKKSEAGPVILDIPDVLSDCNSNQKQTNGLLTSAKVTGFQIDKTEVRLMMRQPCKLCDRQLAYGNTRRSLVYRPVMLSMVAIAAVCVCLGLLFKSSPEVLCVFHPFRWESLDYGSI